MFLMSFVMMILPLDFAAKYLASSLRVIRRRSFSIWRMCSDLRMVSMLSEIIKIDYSFCIMLVRQEDGRNSTSRNSGLVSILSVFMLRYFFAGRVMR